MRLEGHCEACGRRMLLVMLAPPPDGTGGRCPFCGARIADAPEALVKLVQSAEAAFRSLIRAVRLIDGMEPGFRLEVEWDPGRVGHARARQQLPAMPATGAAPGTPAPRVQVRGLHPAGPGPPGDARAGVAVAVDAAPAPAQAQPADDAGERPGCSRPGRRASPPIAAGARTARAGPDDRGRDSGKEERVRDPRIVVGMTDSEGAAAALRWATDLAAALRGEVVVVYAVDAPAGNRRRFPGYADERAETPPVAGRTAQEALDGWCTPLRAKGVRHRGVLVEGEPAAAILDTAEEQDASMIVLGATTRPARGGRARIGDAVVRGSNRPVVLVPVPALHRPLRESALGAFLETRRAAGRGSDLRRQPAAYRGREPTAARRHLPRIRLHLQKGAVQPDVTGRRGSYHAAVRTRERPVTADTSSRPSAGAGGRRRSGSTHPSW